MRRALLSALALAALMAGPASGFDETFLVRPNGVMHCSDDGSGERVTPKTLAPLYLRVAADEGPNPTTGNAYLKLGGSASFPNEEADWVVPVRLRPARRGHTAHAAEAVDGGILTFFLHLRGRDAGAFRSFKGRLQDSEFLFPGCDFVADLKGRIAQ